MIRHGCSTRLMPPVTWRAVAEVHREAQVLSGKPWVCACGPCRIARTGKLRKPKEEK